MVKRCDGVMGGPKFKSQCRQKKTKKTLYLSIYIYIVLNFVIFELLFS